MVETFIVVFIVVCFWLLHKKDTQDDPQKLIIELPRSLMQAKLWVVKMPEGDCIIASYRTDDINFVKALIKDGGVVVETIPAKYYEGKIDKYPI